MIRYSPTEGNNMIRRLGARLVDAGCHLFGRANVVRASRFILNRARLDVPNSMATNGEAQLLDLLLSTFWRRGGVVVFDVGANVGAWSVMLLRQAAERSPFLDGIQVHAFEPTASTFEQLRKNLASSQANLNQVALSDTHGIGELNVDGPGAGTNSLSRPPHSKGPAATEVVSVSTVDDYCKTHDISDISLIKIDAEGHDFYVLSGARGMLNDGRIDVIQFEYNSRWIDTRSYLRDVFDLLEPLGYRLGKVTPRGIEEYTKWDPELESFIEGNYVAWRPGDVPLPTFAWWKARIKIKSSRGPV